MPSNGRDAWTTLVGPLTPRESAMVLGSALAGGGAVGVHTARRAGAWRGLLLGVVAVDLVGGMVTFQLGPTRERYARSALGARLGFVLVHGQPFVLPLTGQGTWGRAAARYLGALSATATLEMLADRRPSRRGMATALAAAAAVVDVATGQPGQRWFGPVYLVKLIGGHGGIRRVHAIGGADSHPG